ncbi:MAG TPA: hypothetical protein DF610_18915 [Sphingobacterium sp.]|nr:hypothetical protein [Sphingobacterium sp.]
MNSPKNPDPKLFINQGQVYYMPFETTVVLGQQFLGKDRFIMQMIIRRALLLSSLIFITKQRLKIIF